MDKGVGAEEGLSYCHQDLNFEVSYSLRTQLLSLLLPVEVTGIDLSVYSWIERYQRATK